MASSLIVLAKPQGSYNATKMWERPENNLILCYGKLAFVQAIWVHLKVPAQNHLVLLCQTLPQTPLLKVPNPRQSCQTTAFMKSPLFKDLGYFVLTGHSSLPLLECCILSVYQNLSSSPVRPAPIPLKHQPYPQLFQMIQSLLVETKCSQTSRAVLTHKFSKCLRSRGSIEHTLQEVCKNVLWVASKVWFLFSLETLKTANYPCTK